MIFDGHFDVENLVSHKISLEQVAETFTALQNPEAFAKVIVEPWQST